MRTNQIGDVIYLQMNEKKPGGVHFDKGLVMSFAGRGVGLAVAPKPTQSTSDFSVLVNFCPLSMLALLLCGSKEEWMFLAWKHLDQQSRISGLVYQHLDMHLENQSLGQWFSIRTMSSLTL